MLDVHCVAFQAILHRGWSDLKWVEQESFSTKESAPTAEPAATVEPAPTVEAAATAEPAVPDTNEDSVCF